MAGDTHLVLHLAARHADAALRLLGRTGAARLATSVARRVHSIVLDGMGPHVRELVEADAAGGVLTTSDRPMLNYPSPPPVRVCMSTHAEGSSSHAPISVKCLCSMTLPRGAAEHHAAAVGCKSTVSKPVLTAPMVSALEARI